LLTITIFHYINNSSYLQRFLGTYISTSHSQIYIYWLSDSTFIIPFHLSLPPPASLSDLGQFLNFPGIDVGNYIIKGTSRHLGLSSIWDSIFRSIGLLVLPHHPFFSQNLDIVLCYNFILKLILNFSNHFHLVFFTCQVCRIRSSNDWSSCKIDQIKRSTIR
jgi:hypothetical protein